MHMHIDAASRILDLGTPIRGDSYENSFAPKNVFAYVDRSAVSPPNDLREPLNGSPGTAPVPHCLRFLADWRESGCP